MIVYPAIDLKEGHCVRLRQGDMATAQVYNADPADQARSFVHTGFSWIHVVDLDGAFAGESVNAQAVRAILESVDIPVQLGGGIRTRAQVEAWLGLGVARVILGTVAVREPELAQELCRIFPDQIVIGIDARGDNAAVSGWASDSAASVIDVARRYEDSGAAAIVYTDIDRDGMGQGVNIARTRTLAGHVSLPVIASGGIGTDSDLRAVKALESCGVQGVIVGRAFYEGTLSPEDALAIAHDSRI